MMVEWLTENARRTYPLEREWPEAAPDGLRRLILDAAVGYAGTVDEDRRVMLISAYRSSEHPEAVSLRIGVSADDSAVVSVTRPSGRYGTSFAAGGNVVAFVTVSQEAFGAIATDGSFFDLQDLNIPFATRCTSYATRSVTAVSACAPADPCSRPVYGPGTRHEVQSATGDVVLVSKDGIDVDVTRTAPLQGDVIRVTAVTAPRQENETARPVDMVIRGDACIQVESIPGVAAGEGGAIVPLSEPWRGGVIRLTEKCKPCCQCEDYEAAMDALRPGDAAVHALEAEFDRLRNDPNAGYLSARELFGAFKAAALGRINNYDHVIRSAVAVRSGGITPDVELKGSRCRIAVNLTVANMTLSPTYVRDVTFTVGTASDGYSLLKTHWNTSGSVTRYGDTLAGATWTLLPGDTLVVVATYAKSSTTNDAGTVAMSASFKARLDGLAETTIPVEVL